MAIKNFRLNIAFRLLFLVASILSFLYTVYYTPYYIGMLMLAVLVVWIFWNLIYYIDQTNRELASFILGIKYDDFSVSYSKMKKGKSFGELYGAYNQVVEKFRQIQADKAAHYQYLQTIVEHVNVGLLCIEEGEKVVLLNKKLQELLKKSYLVNFEALERVDAHLYHIIKNIQTGNRQLVKLQLDHKILQLSLQAVEFKLQEKTYKLVSMQNIQSELEEQELVSWQKLIRILTHEIMNSVAPIVSLTASMESMLQKEISSFDQEDMDDFRLAVKTINKRCEGLLSFTNSYRTLTKIPPPQVELIDIEALLKRTITLYQPILNQKEINLEFQISNMPLVAQVDPKLLEQVLINLFKNAVQALENTPQKRILITASKDLLNKLTISIQDNGCGMDAATLDKIFIPFYTTKDDGSGIGLSLSRQIMQIHQGKIAVVSEKGAGTIFTLNL